MPTGFPDYYGGLTLPVTVPEGGTGYTTVTAHTVLVGNDAGKLTLVAPGTAGTVLASNGAALDPSFQTVPAGSILAGAGISIAGSPPTITNTDDAYFAGGILAIAHGGTGTATPALVAGSNIAISGSWPDQTIGVSASPNFTSEVDVGTSGSGFLKLAAAGSATYIESGVTSATGSAAPLHFTTMQGATTLATLDGSGNLTLAGALTIGSPLAIAQGGTGTSSPGLAFGNPLDFSGNTNITQAPPQGSENLGWKATLWGNFYAVGIASYTFALLTDAWVSIFEYPTYPASNGTATAPDSNATVSFGAGGQIRAKSLSLATPLPVASGGTGTATPALVAGAGISIAGSWPDQTITNSDDAYFAGGILAIAHGGTGAASFAAAGLLSITASADKTGQTAALGATTLYTPGGAGMYRITAEIYVADPSASNDRVTASVTFTQNGVAFTAQIADTGSKAAAHFVASGVQAVYCDASTAIQYSTTAVLGAGDSYDVHFRLEAI